MKNQTFLLDIFNMFDLMSFYCVLPFFRFHINFFDISTIFIFDKYCHYYYSDVFWCFKCCLLSRVLLTFLKFLSFWLLLRFLILSFYKKAKRTKTGEELLTSFNVFDFCTIRQRELKTRENGMKHIQMIFSEHIWSLIYAYDQKLF